MEHASRNGIKTRQASKNKLKQLPIFQQWSVLFVLTWGISFSFFSEAQNDERGLIPNIRADTQNENVNEAHAMTSEILITQSETQATNALMKIINKNKNSPQEPDLLYRLSELYMRRAKSGKFFDLHRDSKQMMRMAPVLVKNESSVTAIKNAIKTYVEIQKRFSKFHELDSVMFNHAFANEQIGQEKKAEDLYRQLVSQFPDSKLVQDAHLALGEMYYNQGQFEKALSHFSIVEKEKESRYYSYALYKSGWTYYNLRKNQEAIAKLVTVVRYFDPSHQNQNAKNNLRGEALRDLGLFFSEVHPAEKAYSFFFEFCNASELGESLVNLGKLYESHSRYKELVVFLTEFVSKEPYSPWVLKSQLLMVEALENQKKRNDVLKTLKEAAENCVASSEWRKKNTSDESLRVCKSEYRQVSLEMANKWWEIWQKNKGHQEFAEMTTEIFRIYLKYEDPQNPDVKTRFAFAELLFQRSNFKEASAEYKKVGEQSHDSNMVHDANYAAVVSLQKLKSQDKKQFDAKEFELLSQNYLTKHKNGPHVSEIQFQMGFLEYERENYTASENWLLSLTEKSQDSAIQLKAQDLMLDIYNIRKNYAALQILAEKVAKSSTSSERKERLVKIAREAEFNKISILAQGPQKSEAADQFLNYFKKHPGQDLARQALWQYLSINYALGKTFQAAEASIQFAQLYPKDPQRTQVVAEAASAYAEMGHLKKAAQTLEIMSVNESSSKKSELLETAADFYTLEGMHKDAERLFEALLAQSGAKGKGRLMYKMLKSLNVPEGSTAHEKWANKIIDSGEEPFASEFLLKRLKSVYEKKQSQRAFEDARKLISRSSVESVRAESRYIQARILEDELISQSVKSKIDRIAIVLGLKTEKLEKAQSAYLGVAKMSSDNFLRLKALQGLSRCYRNFIESIEGLQLPEDLSAADQEAVKKELSQLINPIADKLADNESKIRSESEKVQVAEMNIKKRDISETKPQNNPRPFDLEINYSRFQTYLLELRSGS